MAGLSTSELTGFLRTLSSLDRAVNDAERINQIDVLEQIKAACAAAQAQATSDLDTSRRAAEAGAGVPAGQRGKGLAAEVALARHDSVHRGGRHLGLATALVREMPHTYAALQRGLISEWKATLLVKETATLTVQDRRMVDAELAGRLASMSDRQAERAAKALAYRLDPHAVVRRIRGANSDRRERVKFPV